PRASFSARGSSSMPRPAGAGAIGSSAPTRWAIIPTTSAWIRRSARPCSASASATSCTSARRRGRNGFTSRACATARRDKRDRHPKKKPGVEPGEYHRGNLIELRACRSVQPCPVDEPHLVGAEIEVARQQRLDVLRLIAFGRLVHLDHAAEFLIASLATLVRQDELGVVLHAHGSAV